MDEDVSTISVTLPTSAHADALTAFGVEDDEGLAKVFELALAQRVSAYRASQAAQAAVVATESENAALFGVDVSELHPPQPQRGPGGPRGL